MPGRSCASSCASTQLVAAAYAGVAGEGRVERAASASRASRPPCATRAARPRPRASGPTGVEAALGRRAGRAARPRRRGRRSSRDRAYRELLAGLIADAAAGESALLTMLDRPPTPTAFPGQPV